MPRRRFRVRYAVAGWVIGSLIVANKTMQEPYWFERGITDEFLDSVLARARVARDLGLFDEEEGNQDRTLRMVGLVLDVTPVPTSMPGTGSVEDTARCEAVAFPRWKWHLLLFSPFLVLKAVREAWGVIKSHDPAKEVVVLVSDFGVFGTFVKAYKRPWPPTSGVTEVNYQQQPPPGCHLLEASNKLLAEPASLARLARIVRKARADTSGADEYVCCPDARLASLFRA